MKNIRTLLVYLLVAVLLLGAVPASAEGNWYDKYEETVEFTVGRTISAYSWPEGEDFENNVWSKWLEEEMGMKVKAAFLENSGEDHIRRFSLALSTGELPDLFVVPNKEIMDMLIAADLVEDLTDVYEEYASPLLRAEVESYGQEALFALGQDANGRLMGFPDLQPGYQYALTWIRQDWLDKLGLETPKTLEDVIATAKAFVDNDMAGDGNTIGILFNGVDCMNTVYNANVSLDPIWNLYEAYPGRWMKNEEGDVVYGSIQPETKEALAVLRDIYAQGLTSKDFASIDMQAVVAAGYPGIVFGPWWTFSTPLMNAMNNFEDCEWRCIITCRTEDGKYNTYNQQFGLSYGAVRKGYEHPEILIKLLNLNAEYQADEQKDAHYGFVIPAEIRNAYLTASFMDWGAWPINIITRFNDNQIRVAQYSVERLEDYKAGGRDYPEAMLEQLDYQMKYESGEDTSDIAWRQYMYVEGRGAMLEIGDDLVINEVYYPYTTETMEFMWEDLQTLEKQTFVNIVTGAQPLDAFDTFVEEWLAGGGEDITAEVDAQAKGK